MNDEQQQESLEVEESLKDLRERLDAFIERAQRTDENLHLTRFKNLDRDSLTDLVQIAHAGRTRVPDHEKFLARNGFGGDGTFWNDLFLVISAVALSYEEAAGEPFSRHSDMFVITLVLFSQYTTPHRGDIMERNREALTNILWAVGGGR